jgi:hypothetical protein
VRLPRPELVTFKMVPACANTQEKFPVMVPPPDWYCPVSDPKLPSWPTLTVLYLSVVSTPVINAGIYILGVCHLE